MQTEFFSTNRFAEASLGPMVLCGFLLTHPACCCECMCVTGDQLMCFSVTVTIVRGRSSVKPAVAACPPIPKGNAATCPTPCHASTATGAETVRAPEPRAAMGHSLKKQDRSLSQLCRQTLQVCIMHRPSMQLRAHALCVRSACA